LNLEGTPSLGDLKLSEGKGDDIGVKIMGRGGRKGSQGEGNIKKVRGRAGGEMGEEGGERRQRFTAPTEY